MESLSAQAREILRAEMAKRRLSQRDVSGILGGTPAGWSQSRVAKILTGRVEMGVDELQALCFALSLPITEVVRDRGLEFCAEMTPTELRLLERIRQLPPAIKDSLMTLLQLPLKSATPERHATKREKVEFRLPHGRAKV